MMKYIQIGILFHGALEIGTSDEFGHVIILKDPDSETTS